MKIPAPVPEHLPFLREIVDQPREDMPRLVFADFLEESGDANLIARAHYIRAQIALESMKPRTREFLDTRALVQRIEKHFRSTFYLELPYELIEGDDDTSRVLYRRGFVDTLALTSLDLGMYGYALFEAYPILGLQIRSGTRLTDPSGWLGRFKFLERLRTLGFGPHYYALVEQNGEDEDGDEGSPLFQEIMTTPILKSLEELTLRDNRINDAWLVRFVSQLERAAFASTLRRLDLAHCLLITDAGANVLATARSLEGLEFLSLKGVQLQGPTKQMLKRRFGASLEV